MIIKLTPNVTDITEIAKAAVYGGANALSLINTLQGMKIDIHKALLSEVERLAELTQRTNKCTNGVRFTVKNIKDLMNKTDSYIYSVFLSDKYADLGLIGAIGVIDDNLMLFNVSCRALGREVENNLFQFIKEKHVIERIMFKATGKNEYLKILISEFFPRIRIEE